MWIAIILAAPVFILLTGVIFLYTYPKSISNIYGYRTAMSKKNQDTWNFANRLAAKRLIYFYFLFIILVLIIIFILGKDGIKDIFGSLRSFNLYVSIISPLIILIIILTVELKLKKTFDTNGNRR